MPRAVASTTIGVLLALAITVWPSRAQPTGEGDHPDIQLFFQATAQDGRLAREALRQIGDTWRPGYAAIIWDLKRFSKSSSTQ